MSLSYLISKSILLVWTTPTATMFSTFSPSGLFFTSHDWSIKSIDILIWESVLKCKDLVLEVSIFYYWSSHHDYQKCPWIPGHTKIVDCHRDHGFIGLSTKIPANRGTGFTPKWLYRPQLSTTRDNEALGCLQSSWDPRRFLTTPPFQVDNKGNNCSSTEKKSIVLRPGGEFFSSLLIRMQLASSPLPSANQDLVPPPINHLPKQS